MERLGASRPALSYQTKGGTAISQEAEEVHSVDSYSPRTVTIPPKIEEIYCPRNCGWFRAYTRSDEWMKRMVAHPLYGLILESDLVRIEVQDHSCREYRNAIIRKNRRKVEREHSAEA